MPTCAGCKQSHFGMFQLKAGFCESCRDKRTEVAEERKRKRQSIIATVDVEEILLTTEHNPQGLVIQERVGIVSSECAFGMNAFKDLFSGVRDVVGGRSEAIQQTLKDSREVVLSELRLEAAQIGATGVVAIDFEYVDLSSAGNMILLVGNGTAVRFAT